MIKSLVKWLALATLLAAFHRGPSIILAGPLELYLYDILFLLTLGVAGVYYLVGGRLVIPVSNTMLTGGAYPAAILVVTILGCIYFAYPLYYIVGDLKWVQAGILSLVIYNVHYNNDKIINSIGVVAIYGLLLNAVFVYMQLVVSLGGPSYGLLEWWYMDVPQADDYNLGFYIGRYAGAAINPSVLGAFAAFSIAYLVCTSRDLYKTVTWLTLAVILLIASGSRTAIVAAIAAVAVLIMLDNDKSIAVLLGLSAVSIAGVMIAVQYDLGRAADPQRYEELLGVVTGNENYLEVSNRGERWDNILDIKLSKYPVGGTLSNPSYALGSTIDSAYIHIFVRFGLLLYFITLSAPLFSLHRLGKSKNVLLSISIMLVIGILSLNANTVTGLHTKNLLLTAVVMAERS